MQNHYAVLGVTQDAESVVIRAAYRALVQKYHPDKVPEAQRAAAHSRMVAINEAFHVLEDPSARLAFDAELSSRRGSSVPEGQDATTQTHPYRWPGLLGYAPQLVFVMGMLFFAYLAAAWGVEKKGWVQMGWEYVTGGLHKPSSYEFHWLVIGTTLLVGYGVSRFLSKRIDRMTRRP